MPKSEARISKPTFVIRIYSFVIPTMPAPLISGLDPAALLGLGTDETSSAAWEPPTPEEVARLFPQWQMKGMLGRGGMGAVYHLHQPDLDRDVAIKLLPIEASRDERQVERFRREARTLAKLRHPGIVALHESGITPAGHFYFVMEHVDGCPLSDLIAAGKLDVPRAIEVVRQVCDALAYAHEQGVIHRDIKPSNILIDSAGQVKVADFGLARLDRPSDSDAMTLSHTGAFMGTPAYTAPEQARDAAHVDHRADLYSLGVLLYEMLTGELPRGVFQPPSRKAGSDARLDDVVQRALQERPEDRYQAAADIKRDVTSVRSPAANASQPSKRRFPWAAVLTVVLLIGAVILFGSWLTIRSIFESLDSGKQKSHVRVVEAPPVGKNPNPPVPPAKVASTPPVPTKPEKNLITPSVPSPPTPGPPKVHVWSIDPLSPALHPPPTLASGQWQDAVLLSHGGAALLKDGSVVMWHESSPGKEHRLTFPEPVISLSATPSEAVARSQTGTTYLLPNDASGSPRKITAYEAQRFPSGSQAKPIPLTVLPSSSSLTEPAQVIAIEGISLAHDLNGKAVLWGPKVTDSPQRFHLPEGTVQVRLGPTGLMAAW
jgi:serine/threonine protein kinase